MRIRSRLIPAFILMTLLLTMFAVVSAQRGRSIVERVHFQRGRTTAVLKGAVVRGMSHDYLLGARSGQSMSVHLASSGDVRFTILNPDGDSIADYVQDWSGELPLSGDYRINVLPDTSRRSAIAYTLEVTIR